MTLVAHLRTGLQVCSQSQAHVTDPDLLLSKWGVLHLQDVHRLKSETTFEREYFKNYKDKSLNGPLSSLPIRTNQDVSFVVVLHSMQTKTQRTLFNMKFWAWKAENVIFIQISFWFIILSQTVKQTLKLQSCRCCAAGRIISCVSLSSR